MAAAYKAVSTAAAGVAANVMGANRPQGPPHWQVQQFECMQDTNVCLQTCLCPFCTEANVISMRDRGVPEMEPITCVGVCCLEILTRGGFSNALTLGIRRELVARYGIQEEPYCQSIITNICSPCSFCQIQREMAMRNEHPGGFCAKPPEQGGVMGAVGSAAAVAGTAAGGGMANFGSGLFEFAGFEDCCDSCCLAPCTMAFMANRVDAGRSQLLPKDVENKMDAGTCVGTCFCSAQTAFALRRELIDRYQMFEPHLMSAVIVACCACCSVGQVRREMGYRGEWPSGLLQKEAPAKTTAM